ncbi:hypothetical protein FRC07_009961 [Ceratobasidium sp. 392]|nr:hypothetical protein FRC07_009961 [Ceratobasidium sp. 392]
MSQSGLHWAAITISFKTKSVVYKSSLLNHLHTEEAVEADKGFFKAQEWTFVIDGNTPQQANGYDCGVFVFLYLLEAALGANLPWQSEDIAILRPQIAIQILHSNSDPKSFVLDSTSPHQEKPQPITASTKNPHQATKQQHSNTPTPSTSPEQSQKQTVIQTGLQQRLIQHKPTKRLKITPAPFKGSTSTTSEDQNPFKVSAAQQRALELLDWQPADEDSEAIAAEISAQQQHWPKEVSLERLPSRVQKLLPFVVQLVQDPTSGFAFKPAAKLWANKGRAFCVSAQGIFQASMLSGLAYYGDVGGGVIFQQLKKAIASGQLELDWSNWQGLRDTAYAVEIVLAPEVVCRLVMDDMDIDETEALEVMQQSREYGQLGNTRLI